jgi:hypothetical protein
MTQRKVDFRSPRLRPGVQVGWQNEAAVIEYRDQGCDLAFPAEAVDDVRRLFAMLADGASVPRLERSVPALREQLPALLQELDRLGLLVETEIRRERGGQTGVEFYRRVRRLAARIKARGSRNEFYRALARAAATREQLAGYALEYYHLVHYAPRLIAPALAHTAPRRTERILQQFLASELGHDRMLLESLAAAGIQERDLEYVMPLPSTFALISALGVFAAQDPLSFKAVLFVYEEADDRFNRAFVRCCERAGLPPAFSGPIARHAAVNEEYDHGDISRQLMEDVPYVSPEEQQVVVKHVVIVIETLIKMEREILDHYSRPGSLPAVA